ncbi:hypothetical protein [Streptomyces roseolilacinus]|uniref:Secreted protein n=1 Tax=Streptomyces roseolilacinus TaxID=66904 RepID=A0A918EM02_9ACTN|nr:hypothetical protein [Streptomyces roseolilacinus]GGQ12205.1 hypothetical protein GCM10010249_33560 [Streptomyces roseolilacinus]
MNLRMIGLGVVAVASTLLPMVALAGPADHPEAPAHALTDDGRVPGPGPSTVGDAARTAPASDRKSAPVGLLAETDGPSDTGAAGLVARCGPALVAPDGVEAQTCVLADGAGMWARTYHRNTGGAELRVSLSLMGPAGRTVRAHCVVPVGGEPGTCETPRDGGAGGIGDRTAVAEFAAGDDPGSPLLLRAGSNHQQ